MINQWFTAIGLGLPGLVAVVQGTKSSIWGVRYLRGSKPERASLRRANAIKFRWKRNAKLLDLIVMDSSQRPSDFIREVFRDQSSRRTSTAIRKAAPAKPRPVHQKLKTSTDEFSVTVDTKVIGKLNASRWQDSAENLAQVWRVQRVKVTSPKPGRIRARAFLREPLDALIPSPLITDHADLWLPAVAPGSLSPDHPILLMVDEDGERLEVTLSDMAHVLIAGVTRSGKSITVNNLLSACSLMHSVRLRIIDANLGTVAPWWRTAHTVCDDIDLGRPTEILQEVREEMEKRKALFWQLRTDKLTQFTPDLPIEVLVIDELANYAKHPDKKKRELFLAELLAVASQGHKFGVRIVLITQKPEADILPTSIRTNLSARICHRVDTVEDFKHAFPGAADMDITAADRSMPAGVAIAQLLGMRTAVRARSVFTPSQACWSISDAICAQSGQLRALPVDGHTMGALTGELDEADYLATATA